MRAPLQHTSKLPANWRSSGRSDGVAAVANGAAAAAADDDESSGCEWGDAHGLA